MCEQIAALVAVNEGVLDDVPLDDVTRLEGEVRKAVSEELPDLCDRIEAGEDLSEEDLEALAETARRTIGKGKEESEDG